MGRKLLAAIASIFLIGQASADPGRYQLIDTNYQFININGEEFQIPALILLDTSTGEMKICSSAQYSGRVIGRDEDKDYQVRNCDTQFEIVMEIPRR